MRINSLFFAPADPGVRRSPQQQTAGLGVTQNRLLTDEVRFSGARKEWAKEDLPPLLTGPDPALLAEIRALSSDTFFTKAQELALGRAIQWGLYAQARLETADDKPGVFINTEGIESAVHRANLMSEGAWAEEQLAKRYQLSTFKTVKKQANYFAHPQLPNLETDLQSAANQKLTQTLRAYNPNKNCKFSTIYIMSLERDLLRECRRQRAQLAKLNESTSFTQGASEGHQPLSDRMADPKTVAGDTASDRIELAQALDSAMTRLLDEREQGILRMRLAAHTLEEVGAEFGVTRERVRQIEAACHRTLSKAPELRQIFHVFPDDAPVKLKKPATSPETLDAIYTQAYEFVLRQSQLQTFTGREPEFFKTLDRHDRAKHQGQPPAIVQLRTKEPTTAMVMALEKMRKFPLTQQVVGALLSFGFEPQDIANALEISKALVVKMQRAFGGETSNTTKLKNPSISEHQLIHLNQLKGMTQQVVALKHGVGSSESLSNVDVAMKLFGSKAHPENLHMLWVYACAALRLEHLQTPVAPIADFDKVHRAVRALSQPQRRVIETYYGLVDGFPQTRPKMASTMDWGVPDEQRTSWVSKHYQEGVRNLCLQTGLSKETLATILMASTGSWTDSPEA